MDSTYETHDISVAAYFLQRGKKIIDVSIDKKTGNYRFVFDNSAKDAKAIALEFLSSECFRYDGYMRMLRGMLKNI